MRSRAAAAGAIVCVLLAAPAHADETAQRAAQVLFDEGRALMVAERWDEACDRFARSEALSPAAGTLLNLGLCYEKQQRLATARTTYEQAIALAAKHGESTRVAFGRARIAAIVPDLAYVVVTVAEGAPAELELLEDGAPLPRAALGVEIPTDIGPHAIEARAPGYVHQLLSFRLAARDHAAIVVPPLVKEAPPPVDVIELGPGPMALPPLPPPPPLVVVPPRTTSPLRTTAWITLAVGAAALVTGAALGIAAKVDYDGADCTGVLCSPSGIDRRDRAFAIANASTGTFVASGVLATLALTFFVVGGRF